MTCIIPALIYTVACPFPGPRTQPSFIPDHLNCISRLRLLISWHLDISLLNQWMFILVKPPFVKFHQESCFSDGLITKPILAHASGGLSPTQLGGSLATAFLVMTSESLSLLGFMGHAMHSGHPADSIFYADASYRFATPGHFSFPLCASGYEFRIASTCPYFCPGEHLILLLMCTDLYHICDAHLLFRKDGSCYFQVKLPGWAPKQRCFYLER